MDMKILKKVLSTFSITAESVVVFNRYVPGMLIPHFIDFGTSLVFCYVLLH